MTEDEMVEWHRCLSGHEFEQTLGDGEGQESLVRCSPWDSKESDNLATEQQQPNRSVEAPAYAEPTKALFCFVLLSC